MGLERRSGKKRTQKKRGVSYSLRRLEGIKTKEEDKRKEGGDEVNLFLSIHHPKG